MSAKVVLASCRIVSRFIMAAGFVVTLPTTPIMSVTSTGLPLRICVRLGTVDDPNNVARSSMLLTVAAMLCCVAVIGSTRSSADAAASCTTRC